MNGTPETSRFPNSSDEYRRTRNALFEAEKELRRQVESVAAQPRELRPDRRTHGLRRSR